jgi:hypothetical protein
MLSRLVAALLLLLPLAAQAQYQGCRQLFSGVDVSTACIQLSGSNVLDINGNKLAAGRFVLTVTDSSGTPVSYTPAGGTSSSATFVGQIINGAVQNIAGFPFSILNTLTASPSGLVFHYQLESSDGSTVMQDYPLWNITSTTGGYSLDSFNALPGTTISGYGPPRTSCSPTAKYNQTGAPMGAKPWICSNLWRTDKSNQWTQNPSSNPQCQMGQAAVSPRTGPQYCILPENAYALPGEGFTNPSTTTPGPIMIDPLASGGANLPHTYDLIAGDNTGNGVAVPEKGTTPASGPIGVMAWDEDYSAGRFDPRNPAYAGGVYGSTPGAAWQAFSDRLVCYESMTGRHPHIQFPPGTFSVGTLTNPTLKLPSGGIYMGGGGWGFATNATQFQATYNNYRAVEFDPGLTSTTNCSDGTPHTANLGGGSYDGFSEHGCGQGGCSNKPGDSGNYPFGGPGQSGISIIDPDSSVGKAAGVYANNNGADGVLCNPQDGHCYEIGGADNNEYFYFGLDVAGQNYQFNSGECHGDVVVGGLDAMNEGPFETYGTFMTPGWEYGHVAGICWSGGLTNLGHYFSQIEEIGVIHTAGGNTEASADSGRIDAPRGDGIYELSNGKTTWVNPRVIAACRFNGAADYLVYSVATTTPGSSQTPNTYLLTGSDGHSQISITVASDGTVSTDPLVTVHSRGMTSTPPTYTLAAGGTPATFTATMENIFQLLHHTGGLGILTACDYVNEGSSGNDTWVSPGLYDNSFFGTSYATGDIASITAQTWITAHGNNGGDGPIWDPAIVAAGYPAAREQRIISADKNEANGGTPASGSTLNLSVLGSHVQMTNSSPATLTNITGGTIMSDLSLIGDGFTTMPEATINGVFGANNCSSHDLLLAKGKLYHYLLTGGVIFAQPPVYTEQCESIFNDYWQPGFWYLAANSALPTVDTQATNDVAGGVAVRPLPPLSAITFTTAGSASSFNYCYAVRVWTSGGTQTTALACNAVTPVSPTSTNNIAVHLKLPINWTRYKIYLNSTTDPSFTPGVWFDVASPNGLPQPTQCDFNTRNACTGAGTDGFFIQPFTPTDTSTIATPNLGLNMTGTYNFDPTNLPASSSTLCVPNQVKIDPTVSTGAIYYCASEDHWVKAPLTWATF